MNDSIENLLDKVLHIGDKVEFYSTDIIDGNFKDYDEPIKYIGEITAFTMTDTVWVGHTRVKKCKLKKVVSNKLKEKQEFDEFIEFKKA